ncbi:MAG: hypothetical protein ACYCRD_06535 [Leptospirillum sp.]
MKNPFEKKPQDENARLQEDLGRWKVMQSHLNDKTDLTRLQPQAARIVGERIENSWKAWAKDSGQLFPETFKDGSGRECTRYSGDIRAAFEPWNIPPLKVKLGETSHFNGRTFIAGQEPPDVRRAMLLAKNGFSE